MPDYEATRAAAHVILDVLSGYDTDVPDRVSGTAMETAFRRINAVGAVAATMNDETGTLTVDATPLMGAILVPLQYLIRQLELYAEISRDDVLTKLREYVDASLAD
jgi:hypothetical protein